MIDFSDFQIGDHRITCPVCGRRPSDKTLGVTINADETGVAHCHRCKFVETFRPKQGTTTRKPTIRPIRVAGSKRTTLSEWGWNLWRESLPISGVALEYLQFRNCVIPPADGDLRWHRALKHPTGYVGPALVALVTNILTKEAMSLHRTWVTPTGKMDFGKDDDGKQIEARLNFTGHAVAGGVIRLWPDDWVTTGLGIAEGIETALSLAHAMQPVWSCIDANHIAQFPVLDGIEALTIAVDADPAGREASDACAERWLEAGKEVFFVPPSKGDINDLVGEEE